VASRNKQLGVDLKVSIQPKRLRHGQATTLIAGGELPTFCTSDERVIPSFDISQIECADLTPYLSGTRQGLSKSWQLPALAWKQVIYNNAIYGVPVPYPLMWVQLGAPEPPRCGGLARQ